MNNPVPASMVDPEAGKPRVPLLWVAALSVLFLLSGFLPAFRFFSLPTHYLPFHTALEFVAMAVSAMVFALAWNLRSASGNSQSILLGTGFLAVTLIDLAHTLSFTGISGWPAA